MTKLVRIDLQVTEEESKLIADLLSGSLIGFRQSYERMIANGTTDPSAHYTMVYRSTTAQAEFARQGL